MTPSERHAGPIIDLHPAFEPARQLPHAGRPRSRLALWGCVIIAAIVVAWLVAGTPRPPASVAAQPSSMATTSASAPLLSLDKVEIVRLYAGGDPAITIDGAVLNETGRQAMFEPLQFALLDSSGMRITEWTLDLQRDLLDPGGRTRFITNPTPLPAAAASVEISIGDGPKRHFALD